MKATLLKKIRKRFVIHYYPDGYVSKHQEITKGVFYQAIDKKYEDSLFQKRKLVLVIPGEQNISKDIYKSHEDALNACKDWILDEVRSEYYRYSIKHKKALAKKQKVWYNQ